MSRLLRFAAIFAQLSASVLAQGAGDAQTPQMILAEIQRLRHELESVTAMVERTQILIFRIQIAETAVNRLTQKVDEARSELQAARQQHKWTAEQIQSMESELGSTLDARRKAQISSLLPTFKNNLEELSAAEQEAQVKVTEAETRLRDEQAKRDDLRDTLDQVDKVLAKLPRPPAQ